MIVSYVATKLLELFDLLLQNVVIAPFVALQAVFDYFSLIVDNGVGLFTFIFPSAARAIMLVIIIAHIALTIYYIVMWCLKKIPMLNIH